MNNFNSVIKGLRNRKSSDGAYPVRTNLINLDEFLTKYGKPIENDFIGDSVKKIPSYCGIKTSEDALSEDLSKVCMAYDDISDRGIVWITEPNRVKSYKKSVLNGSHIGTIGLIDLQSNIESFEELIIKVEFEEYEDQIKSEIDYWKSFYKDGEGHRYFVIVGKNRSLFALPTIYENSILKGNYEEFKTKFEVDVKVWTKFFKTELYRNEKNNMKDSDLMELIGWEAPITDMIHQETKTDLGVKVLPEIFDFDNRVLYKDRELVLDCYSLYCDKYGDNKWIQTQFEKSLRIQKVGKVTFEKVWELFLQVMYVYFSNKQKVKKSQTFMMLVFYTCMKYLNSPIQINETGKVLYTKLYELVVRTHIELDDKKIFYGFKSGGTIKLNFGELKSGMKGSSGWFNSDSSPLQINDNWDDNTYQKLYVPKKQGDVLLELWVNQFFDLLKDLDGIVIPAKRNFDSPDLNYIIKRDNYRVRINGEVYDKNGVPVKFSDVFPNDPFIIEHGTETDYITLDVISIMKDTIQVDHIPPYSKNKEEKNLDWCEFTTSTYNNWKNDREPVYEGEVLEEIQDRIDDLPATFRFAI